MTIISVSLNEIESHTIRALENHGAASWVAKEVAKAVRVAEAENNKICGLYYLDSYCKQLQSGRVDGQIQPEVAQPKSGSIYVDAKDGFAQAAFSKGLQSAVESAKENGICLFVIAHSHTCTSLGYFTAQIAKHGLIGIGTTNAPACVSPPGGNKPILGTNPISMAVPSPNKTVAFQFDQSTSAIAIGKIRMAAAANEAIPEGWAIDRDGNPTTNAEAALGGSLLSSGGYKGYGFGLMAEVLASALTGSVSSINAPPLKTTNDEPHSLGQSYILIDPDFNGKKDQFSEHISKLSTAVEHQPKARLPGSKKKLSSNIEIDATLWDQVLKLASSQPI
ncbi:MAG: (2R)-3-sulfolactate dehydrogenase (NADP+) [Woeseiaceae bacterium]|jgi:(2R)-3-sulfolactate dehydrogenase (NADP+)|tara:strand:- start:206 stop:1210 length:1005 start_codon:yes stop_codon:yes gene_type:complete